MISAQDLEAAMLADAGRTLECSLVHLGENRYRVDAGAEGLSGSSRTFESREGAGNMAPHLMQAFDEARLELVIALMLRDKR